MPKGVVAGDPGKDTKVKDGPKAKAWLTAKGHKAKSVDALVWGTPKEIIESVTALHGQTVEGYRNSGLG